MARLPRHTLRVIVVGLTLAIVMAFVFSSSSASKSQTAIEPIPATSFRDINYGELVGPSRTAETYEYDYMVTPVVTASPEPTAKPTAKPKPKPKPRAQAQSRTFSVSSNYRPNRTFNAVVTSARAYARSRIGSRQFACLDILWDKESGWRTKASNSSSGAYGIPQALPGSKMARAGDDWRTNPTTQVKWGLGYISGRYGSSCNALQHFYRYHWY